MSNKKQMSVIDMLKQDLDIEIKAGVKMIVNWDGYKEMHKEEIIDAFVECWKANMPDGFECKLSAKQYYNETFGGNNE